MLLNNEIPGLPEWPPIALAKERNEIIVGATHLSLLRYRYSRLLFFLIVPTILCEKYFPCRTFVRFTPEHIFINDKKYENSPQVSVQFRANRLALKDDDYYKRLIDKHNRGVIAKGLAFEFKFRRIEMVYGARLVEITSIADEDRAAQFAIALQLGYEMAGQLKANPSRKVSTKRTTEDVLPE